MGRGLVNVRGITMWSGKSIELDYRLSLIQGERFASGAKACKPFYCVSGTTEVAP
jgi:hypothetical protein